MIYKRIKISKSIIQILKQKNTNKKENRLLCKSVRLSTLSIYRQNYTKMMCLVQYSLNVCTYEGIDSAVHAASIRTQTLLM